MKKYPIYYKGKEYEVRWEESRRSYSPLCTTLCIYEVKTIYKFKVYKKVFSFDEDLIKDFLDIKKIHPNNPNYYIEEIKRLFKLWGREIEYKKIESSKEQALANWDGVIEGGE